MKAINFLVFVITFLVMAAASSLVIMVAAPEWLGAAPILSFIVAFFVAIALRVANEWERIVVLRLGKFSSVKGPGVFFLIPIVDQAIFVDTRVLTLDIPKQQVITKDNVPVSINGVVYFRVSQVNDAIIKVQNFTYAMSQYAQATLRDVIGGMTLDQLLAEREKIGQDIEKSVEKQSASWGLEVVTIKIQDIDMPEDLKKMMSRQASAEREKRATITKAEGDRDASINLAAAARTMAESPGAMQLRTLQTIDGLGPTASNTVILGLPMELMDAVKKYSGKS
jgi:regulator of protease activity HflC (stomatin/prohibitin superfamily)